MESLCYARRMSAEVASRELRNNTRSLLDRVARGEEITITVDGRAIARLEPVGRRPRWIPGNELAARLVQADAALGPELRQLFGESTDDAPVP